MENKLSPFRADHVGSFLRPQALKEAREKFTNGEINLDDLKRIEDKEVLKLIAKEKEVGLKSITDGDFRRARWSMDFMIGFMGARDTAKAPYAFHGDKKPQGTVEIYKAIDYNPKHPIFEHFEFLFHHVGEGLVAKQTIPSPNIFLMAHIRKTPVYPDMKDLAHDVTIAYKKTIEKLYQMGCRYLQLDDVFWADLVDEKRRADLVQEGIDPDKMAQLCADNLNFVLQDKPKDLTVTTHTCRGNFRSSWVYSGGYDKIAEKLFSVKNVDGFFLEYDDDRSGDFSPLAKSDNQNIVLGLLTTKDGELEDPEQIKKRINEACQYVSLENLYLSPQCGFSSTEEGNTLTQSEQWEKLKLVSAIANDVWG